MTVLVTSTSACLCLWAESVCMHVCLHSWAAVSKCQRRDGRWLAVLVSDGRPVLCPEGWLKVVPFLSVCVTNHVNVLGTSGSGSVCVGICVPVAGVWTQLWYWLKLQSGSCVCSLDRDAGSLGSRMGSSRWAGAARPWAAEEECVTLELIFRRSWAMLFCHASADAIEENFRKSVFLTFIKVNLFSSFFYTLDFYCTAMR